MIASESQRGNLRYEAYGLIVVARFKQKNPRFSLVVWVVSFMDQVKEGRKIDYSFHLFFSATRLIMYLDESLKLSFGRLLGHRMMKPGGGSSIDVITPCASGRP
jgi:hypothetical protein